MTNTTTEIPNFENYHGAIDMPDSRDYTSEEVFGEVAGSQKFPDKFFLNKVKNLYQGHIGSCTNHGSINAYNEKLAHLADEVVKTITDDEAWKSWEEAKKEGASDTNGFIFQAMLQILYRMKYIGAYININTRGYANVNALKDALYNRKSGIATGLPAVKWRDTLAKKEFVPSNKDFEGGHVFDIIGWDDNHKTSYGKGAFFVENSWGDGGQFWIPYELIHHLYSQYEFLPTKDQEEFIKAKNLRRNEYLKVAFEKKIWNEERVADTATGFEIRVMLNRILALTDNHISEDWKTFRSSYAYLFDYHIARGKTKIYNESNKFTIASDEEIGIMFTRAVTGNGNLNTLVLTRQQVVEALVRDFIVKKVQN